MKSEYEVFPGAQKDDARSRTTFAVGGKEWEVREMHNKSKNKAKSSLFNPATKTILPAVVFDAEVAANHQCLAAAAVIPDPMLIEEDSD
jgi:hypothetical protein